MTSPSKFWYYLRNGGLAAEVTLPWFVSIFWLASKLYGLCYQFFLSYHLSMVVSEFHYVSSLDCCWQRLKLTKLIWDSNLLIIIQMKNFLCVLHWDSFLFWSTYFVLLSVLLHLFCCVNIVGWKSCARSWVLAVVHRHTAVYK